MKKVLALLVVASLAASPAFAYGPDKPDEKSLKEAAAEVVREMVVAESTTIEVTPPQDSAGISGGRTAVGIGMMIGGAILIWKGSDVWQDEPDRFGRVKNADSYTLYVSGGTFIGMGAYTMWGGLKGRGFVQ
jgi:hypothetical protein